MTDLQKRMLLLLEEIDEICKKHEITYFLFAGTALGAARHKGFIPWDDDTDIIMDLENYEKFLGVIKDELKVERALDWVSEDSEYLFTYARYIDTSSTALQRHTVFGGCKPGVKVDIFCAIPTFSDNALREKHKMDVLGFAEVLCTTGKMGMFRPAGFYEVFEREKKKLQKAGREKYIRDNLRELMHRADGETEKCLLFSGMMSNTKTYDRCIFDEAVYVPYEDTELPISKYNDLFSTQHIAESWPNLPPHLEKPRHLLFVDLDRPYEVYTKQLFGKIDEKKTKEASIKRKENSLYERDAFRDVLINDRKIRNLAVEMDIRKRFAERDENINDEQLAELLSGYIEGQMDGLNKTFGLCVDAGEEILRTTLDTLIKLGRYYDAKSIIRTCTAAGSIAADDAFAREILEKADMCVRMMEAAFRFSDREEAKKIYNSAESLAGTLPYEAVRSWLEQDESEPGYKAYLNVFGKPQNGFVLQEMIEAGLPYDCIFEVEEEERPKQDKKMLRATVNSLMTGKQTKKPSIWSDAVTQAEFVAEAERRGLLSKQNKKRYNKYRLWKKMKKQKAEDAFDAYAKVFSNMEPIG
ncbi:MAG: LicD family protein [Firmicutes bacterium]|nr:LicD family protein [Bacillota bacterium]